MIFSLNHYHAKSFILANRASTEAKSKKNEIKGYRGLPSFQFIFFISYDTSDFDIFGSVMLQSNYFVGNTSGSSGGAAPMRL